MDPQQLAQALIQRDPSMSLDLANRIATNLVAPGNEAGLAQYEQLHPGVTQTPGEQRNALASQQFDAVEAVMGQPGVAAYGRGVYQGAYPEEGPYADYSPQNKAWAQQADQQATAVGQVFGTPGMRSYRSGLSAGLFPALQSQKQPEPQAQKQRLAKYHELMAKKYSGQTISPAEREWLTAVDQVIGKK